MRETVVEHASCSWVDVVEPTRDELAGMAREYNLPPTVVEDCLEPEHLPKFERIGDATFIILRVYDKDAPPNASTIQALTRKIAIFFRPGLLLTVHRIDLEEVRAVRQQFGSGDPQPAVAQLISSLINHVLGSFERPLQRDEDTLDEFESAMFDRDQPPSLQAAHDLKRRVSLSRRMLFQTQLVIKALHPATEKSEPLFQDLRESIDAYLFWADQLLEQVNLLLQIHLAMASHRTNEVMRVLTIFSAFFLPLTFIVGVYGMNFHFMPELDQRWGYPAVLLVMLVVAAGIWYWFRQKGWIGKSR